MRSYPHPVTGQPFPSPVPAGLGWPDDPATTTTPIAVSPIQVVELASRTTSLPVLDAEVSVCRACPRLVAWREAVAVEKRRSFESEPYWGRPIAGWGSETPEVLVVGLAPAAHGGNRTGRIFTGDRSGDWLFAALHRAGLAAQPTSVHAGDGQALVRTRMVAAVRCAPPDNKPTPAERDTCAPWFDAELSMVLPSVRAVVCLGSFAWDALLRALGRQSYEVPRPRPRFGHAARVDLGRPIAASSAGPLAVLGCYHPSQQNTFTGKLTEPMLDAVLAMATADLAPPR
jgi:uracil-DNA glycosylase family 4